jgi:hypothetical protein
MSAKLRSGNSWKDISLIKLRSGGEWKNVVSAYLRSGGLWKFFFGTDTVNGPSIAQTVTISKSTNLSTGIITLTGRNYRWSNASSLTYKFKRSRNGGTSWSTIASGTATNPAVGSSNTETYQLSNNLSDVYPNVDNTYTFEVTAVSSTGISSSNPS